MIVSPKFTNGDLELSSAGRIQWLEGNEAVVQKIRRRFHFFRGEWFLDSREGVPYYEHILGRKPSRALIASIFRQILATTPGVSTVDDLTVVYDAAARQSSVVFVVTLDDGAVIQSTDYQPFFIVGEV